MMIFIGFAVSGIMNDSRAEGDLVVSSTNVESQVKTIQQWYQKIESDKSLTKMKIVPKEKDAFIQITRFTNKQGEVQKVLFTQFSSHGVSEETYYYHKGELFFIYSTGSYWKFSGADKNGKTKTVDIGIQDRYYFSGGKCIKALTKRAESDVPNKDLTPLLAKMPNKPMTDMTWVKVYQKRAPKLLKVDSASALEWINL